MNFLNIKRILFFLEINISLLFILSCGLVRNTLPDSELRSMSPKKVFDLGVEKYVNGDYDVAIYYYSKLIELYPNEEELKDWANYEIGYIYYIKNDYKKALIYFDNVINYGKPGSAPSILAAKIKSNILSKRFN